MRGLHTDRLEVFPADHWLTFRGLPAECLGDRSHEAALFPSLHVGTAGVLDLRRPQDGLSLAGHGISGRRDRLLGGVMAYSCTRSGSHKNTASLAEDRGFPGTTLWAMHRLVHISISVRGAGAAACFDIATRHGGPRLQANMRAPSPLLGFPFPVLLSMALERGIFGAGTWIYHFP